MARKTLSERKAEKLAELNRIKAELAELESKAAERIGKIAIAAGLGDLDIDEATLRKEFEALASKFRGPKNAPAPTVQAAPAPSANSAN
ncbi:TraC family protein [Escherichia coli]|uniref:TraC family protein n=1 Tax=Escherichia coli TaxID=562 RepID=UPI0012611F94|nr:TraC family protein [Escherichia coli]